MHECVCGVGTESQVTLLDEKVGLMKGVLGQVGVLLIDAFLVAARHLDYARVAGLEVLACLLVLEEKALYFAVGRELLLLIDLVDDNEYHADDQLGVLCLDQVGLLGLPVVDKEDLAFQDVDDCPVIRLLEGQRHRVLFQLAAGLVCGKVDLKYLQKRAVVYFDIDNVDASLL